MICTAKPISFWWSDRGNGRDM